MDLRALLRLALGNALARRINLALGLLIVLAIAISVSGSALLRSIQQAMRTSLTSTLFGDLVVYASASEEPFGIGMNSMPRLTPLSDFPKIRQALEEHPGVSAVIPIGLVSDAWIVGGNPLDRILERLRAGVRGESDPTSGAPVDVPRTAAHVRSAITLLLQQYEGSSDVFEPEVQAQALKVLREATSDALWARFDGEPAQVLEFLENSVAPLSSGEVVLPVMALGTRLDAFRQHFPRFEIVDGQDVPAGQRGFLFPKHYYEEFLKLRTARGLDRIQRALAQERRIADDAELQRWARDVRLQSAELLVELDEAGAIEATARLQKALGSKKAELPALLEQLFTFDDSTFEARRRIFYSEVAPLVRLYRLVPGDVFAIKAQGRNGFTRSVSFKFYGTYRFRELEKATLISFVSLMDVVSFRELYGHPDPAEQDEIAELEASAGIDLAHAREGFAGATLPAVQVVEVAQTVEVADRLQASPHAQRLKASLDRVYSPEEQERGVVLGAAVVLEEGASADQALAEVQSLSDRQGLNLSAMRGEKSAAFLGNFIEVLAGVLSGMATLVFLVIGVIINSALLLVTLRRTSEIGTLRAIGAQRGFVRTLVLVESLLVVLAFGFVGAGAGALFVNWLGGVGIPAPSPEMGFFFGGEVLRPALGAMDLLAPFGAMLVISALATLYPAVIATRVTPLRAMQSEE